MKKKGMRLVAMIEKIVEEEDKYEVINFLPDIKVKYTDKKEFKIEKNEGYIKIPYAEGIDDLSVIVGENGVGKTRLVNDILSQDEKKLFIYQLGNDKYIYLKLPDKNDRRRTGEHNFVRKCELELKVSSEIEGQRYNAGHSDFKEFQIVKFSNSIEKEGGTILLDLSKDVSTTKLLERNKHRTVVLEDMKNQISFIKELMEKETDLEKLFKSHPILRPIISNKQIVIAFRNTIQEVDFNQEWKFLAQRQLSHFKNRRARFIQYFFDILIYIVISNKNRKINDPEYNQELFNLFVKQTYREVPSYYNGQEIFGSLLKNSREEQRRELEKRLQAGDSKAKEFLDKVIAYNNFFEHAPNGKEMVSNYHSGRTKQKKRLGNTIKTDKVFEELRAIEGINDKVIEHLESLYSSADLIDTTNDIDQFSKIQQLLSILSQIEGENYILKNTGYKNIIDKFMGEITFSWDGLSSGELALLNLFGRLFSIKKGLKAANILLLLDEVDLGLHPEWQRRWISVALPIIKEIFKGKHIQIIMTTHSPIMLSDIYAENVIMLRKDTNGNRIIVENQGMEKNQVTTFGQNIHDLYRDSFFLESTRGEYAKEQIQETTKVLYELELCQDEVSRILDKLKSGEIIFPESNQTNYKDEYKTQYREKYVKLREGILNNSFIREKIQKSSSDDQFKQILKYRIDAIGEQLIKRKLLFTWDKIWFSDTVPEPSSRNSEVDRLLQQLRKVYATNEQVLLKASEIEELMNSHSGEE
ncbi:TPA: AAA family ATPase [Streptococcus suis]